MSGLRVEFRHRVLLFGVTLTISALLTQNALGQASYTAQVRGSVTDQSSAVVVNALVTITNDGTNVSTSVHTDDHGLYLLTGLRPSTYTIKVENLGPSDNAGFTLSDALATGTSYVSSSTDCVNAAGTVTCTSAGLAAPTAPQDVGDADGEHRTDSRPGDVDPVTSEGLADQVRPESAGRVCRDWWRTHRDLYHRQSRGMEYHWPHTR